MKNLCKTCIKTCKQMEGIMTVICPNYIEDKEDCGCARGGYYESIKKMDDYKCLNDF